MSLIEHIERALGQIERGWVSESLPGIQVVCVREQPTPGVASFSTLGLSDAFLAMPGGRAVRLELLRRCANSSWVRISSGRSCTWRRFSFAVGTPFSAETSFTCMVRFRLLRQPRRSMQPALSFPGRAIVVQRVDATHCVCVASAVVATECSFVRENGWEAFENALEVSGLDVFDLARDPVR